MSIIFVKTAKSAGRFAGRGRGIDQRTRGDSGPFCVLGGGPTPLAY